MRKLIASATAPVAADSELLSRMRAAPAKQRRAILASHVRAEVARVMGLRAADAVDVRRGLFDMGMDSLMALDLRSRLQAALGREIPATVAFEFPTIEAITGFLAEQLALETGAEPGAPIVPQPAGEAHADLLERVRQLSDEEVERRLGQKVSGGVSLT